MKKLTVLLFFSLSGHIGMTQPRHYEAGIVIGAQAPSGVLNEDFKPGFGMTLSARQFVSDDVKLGINIGINRFDEDAIGADYLRFIPVTGAVEYYLSPGKIRPYIGSDIGFFRITEVYKLLGVTATDTYTYFGLAPNAGVSIAITNAISLTGNIKYNYVFIPADEPLAWVGVNVGALFSFGKR